MTATEIRIARGRLRLGLSVSSASGATDSNPEKLRMVNTTPRYRPLRLEDWPGLNGDRFSPPFPGLNSPKNASTTKMAISPRPSSTTVWDEILIPRTVRNVRRARPMKKNAHHGRPHPYCALVVFWNVAPNHASNMPKANGSYRK